MSSSSDLPSSPRKRLRVLQARLRGLNAAFGPLVRDARRLADAAEREAVAKADFGQSEVDAHPMSGSAAATAQRYAPHARQLAEQIAPGLGSVDLHSDEWSVDKLVGAGVSQFVRIGALDYDDPVPGVIPLLGRTGWHVVAEDLSAAHRLIQNVVLRVVGAAPAFRLRVDTYDPSLWGTMGVLGRVSSAHPEIVAPATQTPEQLTSLLAELRTISAQRAARMEQLGQGQFEELLDDNPHSTDAYRVVVLLDYPAGIDVSVQRELLRLAATGAQRGICFLVDRGDGPALDDDVEPDSLAELMDPVELADDMIAAEFSGAELLTDPPVATSVVSELCAAIVEGAKGTELPTIPFESTLPPRERWWEPAGDELTAVVGLDDRTPASIRLRSGNPALPHILVGGAVGQGKSNLLLTLVHSLAVRYSPRDLEMYLLDFKHGVEFAGLGPTDGVPYWLPHLRVLGVYSDQVFGLAVLEYLVAELERRSELFKRHGNVTDIADFPSADQARPPRILLVLDEFQILFEEEDVADEAARMIERLVRLGRAYGIHLVLATQTVEGMQRLVTRKDAILGQIPYRIALKSTAADSQNLLGSGNKAAADLRFRGEAIVNANFGSPEDNQRIVVSYAERESLSRLRERLWAMDDDPHPPRIFHLAESASLPRALTARAEERSRRPEAWAGMPISVAEVPVSLPMRGAPGDGVLVLGDSAADALGVLTGLILASVASSAKSPTIVILDGTDGADDVDGGKSALLAVLERAGCSVEVVPGEGVPARLSEFSGAVADGVAKSTYVIGLGLHGIPGMFTIPADGFQRPIDDLQTIVGEGPAQGVITFGWWNRLHVCTEHLGLDRCNIATYVFLAHPQEAVRSVCGPMVRWSSEPHRALFTDGMSPEPRVIVPFAPITEGDVSPLVSAITGRMPS